MTGKEKSKNISVVIPMYNSENTIIRTLESVRNQTAFELILEIIVVDDGSTDDSFIVVNNYANAHKEMPIIIIKKENRGVSSARNEGMKVAKGEYIALLDADDEWLPNKLEIQMKTMKKYPEIDFLGGDSNGVNLRILFKRVDTLYKASIKDLCLKFFPVTPTAIFKKKIIGRIGYFDENQKFAEDGNYFLKICANFNYYHLPIQMAICGGSKPPFGYNGLSANLKGMYEGNIKNIKELKNNGLISNRFYLFIRFFYWIKYLRRIIIVTFRKLKILLQKVYGRCK